MSAHSAATFIRFLREYAPIPRQSNMYHEEIEERGKKMGVKPLYFEHPASAHVENRFGEGEGKRRNLILTGTAGDGKTSLLYGYWRKLGGGEADLATVPESASLNVSVDGMTVTYQFIFDLSKCLPEKGQEWSAHHLDLLQHWVSSITGDEPTRFIVAANDGKLLQALRNLKIHRPSFQVDRVVTEVEDMLASKRDCSDQFSLTVLDLSGLSSAVVFDRAVTALLERSEWKCFEDPTAGAAFSPASPLTKNWKTLKAGPFRERLRTLIELCDVNGFHISVRDMIAMLVNGLLGHPKAAERVMTMDELGTFAGSDAFLASIHRNVFGENLTEERREDFSVFNYFNFFRVGRETSNRLDELLLFGRDLPHLKAKYELLVDDPSGDDPVSGLYESLRRDYLEAEAFDENKRDRFLTELAQQRRRMFFRLPESSEEFDPWKLTVFQYAGRFLRTVLHPLKQGEQAADTTVELLVRGLNRVWSGMLFDEGSKLFLTSGLDFTSARISRLALHFIPVVENNHGEKIEVILNSRGQPDLLVHLLGKKAVRYTLNLMRFEFLVRVAEGALPNSFSRECYEDVLNLKTILLAKFQAASKREAKQFAYLTADIYGKPTEEIINL